MTHLLFRLQFLLLCLFDGTSSTHVNEKPAVTSSRLTLKRRPREVKCPAFEALGDRDIFVLGYANARGTRSIKHFCGLNLISWCCDKHRWGEREREIARIPGHLSYVNIAQCLWTCHRFIRKLQRKKVFFVACNPRCFGRSWLRPLQVLVQKR